MHAPKCPRTRTAEAGLEDANHLGGDPVVLQ